MNSWPDIKWGQVMYLLQFVFIYPYLAQNKMFAHIYPYLPIFTPTPPIYLYVPPI